ncbi:MAG TPA: Rha family transcriptional regulator [Arsenophonus sp.]
MTLQLSTITPKVTVHNGKAITTSQDVANYFGKFHKDVLKKINSLNCSIEFNERNFAPVNYIDSKGEKRPMYEMTKNGFIFLVMGFTRKKSAQFKEAYIAEFDQMESELAAKHFDIIGNANTTNKADLIALLNKLQKVIHEGDFIPAGQSIHKYNLPKTHKTHSNIINDFINYPKKDTLHIFLA